MARVISSADELREIVPPPTQVVADKAIDHIDDASRRFVEASPFFLLATAAADGTCDVSPRGDPPGSVLVLDRRTLAFGDRKGNRRLDSLRNILANPWVGMLFLVPGLGDTLRVNGTARASSPTPATCRNWPVAASCRTSRWRSSSRSCSCTAARRSAGPR